MPTFLILFLAAGAVFSAWKIDHLQGAIHGRQLAARQLYAECKRRGWVA